eukprot:6189110-Pleurochrysis_carterae.AAC.1
MWRPLHFIGAANASSVKRASWMRKIARDCAHTSGLQSRCARHPRRCSCEAKAKFRKRSAPSRTRSQALANGRAARLRRGESESGGVGDGKGWAGGWGWKDSVEVDESSAGLLERTETSVKNGAREGWRSTGHEARRRERKKLDESNGAKKVCRGLEEKAASECTGTRVKHRGKEK